MIYYTLLKDYKKKIKNKLKEFCIDKDSYGKIEDKIVHKKFNFEKNKVSLAYYIERWYSSDIVIWDRLWLVKEDVIKWLKERLWEERLKEQVEFYKIYLLPERYALEEDEKLFKMIIEWKKLEGLIDEYYIMNVLNYTSKYDIFKRKDKDILLIKEWWVVIFKWEIKEIIEKFDLGIYKLHWCYESNE